MYICVGKTKNLQESIKQENNPHSNFKTIWHLEQIGIGGANIDNATELPSFVLKAIKVNLLQKVICFFLYIIFI